MNAIIDVEKTYKSKFPEVMEWDEGDKAIRNSHSLATFPSPQSISKHDLCPRSKRNKVGGRGFGDIFTHAKSSTIREIIVDFRHNF